MHGFNGGLIGVRRNISFKLAPGIWTPREQCEARSAGEWPVNITPVYSQSTVYPGTTPASLSNMTNGSFNDTGTATNTSSLEWVKVDYGAPVKISSVTVGTATSNIPGGWSKTYTENKDIEASLDDITWTLLFNTKTFSADGIYTFNFSQVIARYIRIKAGAYIALSEFYAS